MRDVSAEDEKVDAAVLTSLPTTPVEQVTALVTSVVSWIESMLAGAMAGAVAKTVIAPGDRVKIIFQADAQRKFSMAAALKVGQKIVEHSGVRGLWTGHGATLLRIMPYAATSYTTYDAYAGLTSKFFGVKKPTKPEHGQPSTSSPEPRAVAARFFAGSAAGATATLIVYPLDLLRARYAAHWDVTKRYPSYLSAFRGIIRDEGPAALYSGLRPALIGIVPYAGITFATYETLKSTLTARLPPGEKLQPIPSFLCGALAGLVGQSTTYPLDIVRRRMQVHPLQYPTMTSAFQQIVRTEGVVGGLFKGLSMNWIKGPISVGVSFATRDYFKVRIKEYHRRASSETPHPNSPGGRTGLSAPEKLICGAVAGGCAKLWTLPFDRMRIMFAVGHLTVDEHGSRLKQIPATIRTMLDLSPNMWQGSGAMMMRVVPYAALTYTSFEHFQSAAERVTYSTTASQKLVSDALAGAMAATFATMVLYPVELLHARTVTHGLGYASYMLALRDMRRQGGSAMYRGVRSSVVGVAPTAGIGFSLYHGACTQLGVRDDNFAARLVIGTAAGATAQLATYPLNVARRTAQVEEMEAGIIANLSKIYRVNGLVSGLYRRMPLGWILSPTTVGLSFAINDAMGGVMRKIRLGNQMVHWRLAQDEGSQHTEYDP